jgi:hypothetical protein
MSIANSLGKVGGDGVHYVDGGNVEVALMSLHI